MTIQQEIAASVEDVQQLLDDNRSLSIAFLSRTIRDLKQDIERRSDYVNRKIQQLEAENSSLKERLNKAGESFRELEKRIDSMG